MKVSTERCDEEKENQISFEVEEEFFLILKRIVRVNHSVVDRPRLAGLALTESSCDAQNMII
jgi:hypothetical protein